MRYLFLLIFLAACSKAPVAPAPRSVSTDWEEHLVAESGTEVPDPPPPDIIPTQPARPCIRPANLPPCPPPLPLSRSRCPIS